MQVFVETRVFGSLRSTPRVTRAGPHQKSMFRFVRTDDLSPTVTEFLPAVNGRPHCSTSLSALGITGFLDFDKFFWSFIGLQQHLIAVSQPRHFAKGSLD